MFYLEAVVETLAKMGIDTFSGTCLCGAAGTVSGGGWKAVGPPQHVSRAQLICCLLCLLRALACMFPHQTCTLAPAQTTCS